MLINLWAKYENYILQCSDTKNILKLFFSLFLSIFPFFILNILIGYFIWNFNFNLSYYVLLFLSIPLGRLLNAYIMYKNNLCFINGNNWFTLSLFIFGMLTSIIGGTYLIIKDINGGFEEEQKINVQKEFKVNTTILDSNILNTNKYDYLIQDKKSNE